MTGYITENSLGWIGDLLRERFGLSFRLCQVGTSCLRLELDGASRSIEVAIDSTMFKRADSDLPCAMWDAEAEGWKGILQRSLPAPGASLLPTPLVCEGPDGYRIGYDVLGLTYWMLTRQEEVGRADLDEHDRFPATASHAHRYGYIERPIVDEWLDILGQVVKRTWPDAQLPQHEFATRVSHDVDRPSRYGFGGLAHMARAAGGDLLKRRSFEALLAPVAWARSPRTILQSDPYNTFDWLMDASEKQGLISAFYFICGRTDARHDALYEVGDPAIRTLLRRIHARGHEIGLHPSYQTYLSPELIAKEARRLRQVCAEEGIAQPHWGGRMHYLRWRQPDTMQAWASAGMDYDSTLGYADAVGFRGGTCHEFQGFDPTADAISSVRIRPLIAMDTTVLSRHYMHLSAEQAIAKLTDLKNSCRSVGGQYCLLWHNSELLSDSDRNIYLGAIA